MKTIDIGGLGVNASQIALGCMRISSLNENQLDYYIHEAVESGINFFDHADIYGGGACETAFGRVLSKDSSLRSKIIIQSKCGIGKGMYDFSKRHILESVDGILSRLGIDYLDFLLLHRPDALMEPEEVGEAFDSLEAAGKVRHFGVSNFNSRQLELLQSGLKQRLAVNQMQFSIMCTGMIDHALCTNTEFPHSADRDGEILDYCRLNNVTMQAWSPFQYGMFQGVFIDNEKFPELNTTLGKLSEKYGISKSALAVAWILRHPAKMQVIVGTTNHERLKDICSAGGIELSRADWYEIYLSGGNKLP